MPGLDGRLAGGAVAVLGDHIALHRLLLGQAVDEHIAKGTHDQTEGRQERAEHEGRQIQKKHVLP